MSSDLPASSGLPQPPRARRGTARPDPAPLFQGLDRLRDFVHQRLDRIESLALERATAAPGEPSERERELRRRIAELEERQTRLVAEARRREQEWESGLAKLENDRRLITEAWERLERERIDGGGAGTGQPAQRPAYPNPAPPPAPNHLGQPASPVFRPAVTPESNDVITHAILRQFQALRTDVRRNANGRRP